MCCKHLTLRCTSPVLIKPELQNSNFRKALSNKTKHQETDTGGRKVPEAGGLVVVTETEQEVAVAGFLQAPGFAVCGDYKLLYLYQRKPEL